MGGCCECETERDFQKRRENEGIPSIHFDSITT